MSNIANCKLIEGCREKIHDWHCRGYNIILTTGRTENFREVTEKCLTDQGILYDQLVMGLGPGPRVLINDANPRHQDKVFASAIQLPRNQGLKDIELR